MDNYPETPKSVKTIEEAKERLKKIDKSKLKSNAYKAKAARSRQV